MTFAINSLTLSLSLYKQITFLTNSFINQLTTCCTMKFKKEKADKLKLLCISDFKIYLTEQESSKLLLALCFFQGDFLVLSKL